MFSESIIIPDMQSDCACFIRTNHLKYYEMISIDVVNTHTIFRKCNPEESKITILVDIPEYGTIRFSANRMLSHRNMENDTITISFLYSNKNDRITDFFKKHETGYVKMHKIPHPNSIEMYLYVH